MAKLKAAVLISGRGSNMAALIEACRAPDFPAEIALVFSNRAEAPGVAHARRYGIAVEVMSHKGWADREAFDRAMSALLERAGCELVCLAGYMRIFSPWFVARWAERIVNIHPSLLPLFKGLHPQRQALAAGVRLSGCTVHYVTADLDAGPTIAQAAVPVHQDDDEETLAARILEAEHRIYPLVLRWFGEGRVSLQRDDGGERVVVRGVAPGATVLWPT